MTIGTRYIKECRDILWQSLIPTIKSVMELGLFCQSKYAWIVNEFSMVLPTCTYQYRLDYRMEISPQRRSTMEMLTQVHTYWDTSQCVKQGLKGNSRKQDVRMFILGSAHTPKYMSLNPNEWRICTQSMR